MTLEGPGGLPPCLGGPPPTPESCPAIGRTAGSMAGPEWQCRYCKKWGLKINNNNRILNLVFKSSFHRAFQILGTSILAIFQVTGQQLGSKFSPGGPALGHVKNFHPLFVKIL